MKLLEVLEKYYVLPYGHHEIVDFYVEETDDIDFKIYVTWTDSHELNDYRQEFFDQDIKISRILARGMFSVVQTNGEMREFIALDGVKLEVSS